MNAERLSVAALVELMLEEFRITVPQLKIRSRLSKSYMYHLKNNENPVDTLPLITIEKLAASVELSPADLYLRAGIDVFAAPKLQERMEYENLRLSPLVDLVDVEKDIRLQQAINLAIRARRDYYYEGKLARAAALLERAFNFAAAAGANRLATYFKIHLSHLFEMSGKLELATAYCRAAEKEANDMQKDGRKNKDKDFEWLGMKLGAQVKVRRLWSDYWAKGVSLTSLSAGETLVGELEEMNVPQEIPNVYYFLARCASALEQFDGALNYLRIAKAHVLALANDRIKPFELFLDTGIATEGGQPMYSWKEDQMIAIKADILVRMGHTEQAWKEYATVSNHSRPRLYLSFFSWHDPRWQSVLHRHISEEKDHSTFGYSTADWDSVVWNSGYMQLQTMTKYDEGCAYLKNGDTDAAANCFANALKLAQGCSAEDLLLKVIISASVVNAMQGDKPLAISDMNMIQKRVERMKNPLIAAQYNAAFQRIRAL